MASAEQSLLESPTDVFGQISQRLEADGLNPQCGEGEKLLFLWKLYQQLELDLRKARENEEKLKEAQTEEMKEVENYVEHIRHLSDEREALIQELETENEQLKNDLEQVRSEINGDAQKEASEMLTQQGLGEIAEATPSEQVAYLLVERARLLDELEGNQTPASQSAASGGRDSQELKEILEQERKDFDKELSQQRESATMMKDQLRKEHEEEISALMDENSKLEEELQEVKKKASNLERQLVKTQQEQNEEQDILEEERSQMEHERDEALKEKQALVQKVAQLEKEKEELEMSKDSLEKEKEFWKLDSSRESCGPSTPPIQHRPSSPSPLRSTNDVMLRKVIEDKTKIEQEMIQLRGQVRSLRNEKEASEEEAAKSKKDADKLQVTIQQLQVKNKNLRQELEELEAQLDDAETALEEAKEKEKDMTTKWKIVSEEAKKLKSEVQRNTTLQDIIDILSNEKSELTATLDKVKKEMHKVLAEKEDLSIQHSQLSQDEKQLSAQLASLKEDLAVLEKERDGLFVEREDLLKTQNSQGNMLTTMKTELSSAQSFREKLLSETEHMEKDIKELRAQLEEAKTEVSTLRHTSQELAKQELIVEHLKEQNTGLTNQVAELKSELEWARKTEQSLIDSQQTSQRAHTDSERRMAMEIDDLRLKLQHALTELQAIKIAHNEQLSAKTSLSEQLSLTESQLRETLEQKNQSQQELRTKSELELKVKDLETRLVEKSRLADSYDGERKQRLELESKYQELSKDHDTQVAHLKTQVQKETEKNSELEMKVEELEHLLDDARMEGDTMQSSLKAKANSMEIRVQKLQDDLFSAQDEMNGLQEKYEQALSDAEEAKSEMMKYQAQAMEQASFLANKYGSVEDLEESLNTAQKQLQDSLNELNLANTKISQLEDQLATAEAERKKSFTDYKSLTVQKELDSNKLEEMENTIRSLRRDLTESVTSLNSTRSQLKDKQNLLDAVRHEMESLNRELEYLRETSASDSDEKMNNRERVKAAEVRVRQLELENTELTRKLSDSVNERERLAEKLEKEKTRHTDSHHQSARYVEQLEVDLNSANKHIRSLRDELQHNQTSVFKLEADNLGQTAKYESMVTRLEAELKELKQNYRRESDAMGDKVATASAECRDAKNELREKEQNITELKRDLTRVQTSNERLQTQLASECKTRSDVENRNITLEQEMTNVWGQVRVLMERNTNLESSKKLAEEELERKKNRVRELEGQLSSKESSLQSSIREWQSRAEVAEKHEENISTTVKQLEEDLKMMATKATMAEKQLHHTEVSQTELSEKAHQLAAVRNQLESEKLQRTILDQTVAELKHQVSLLKQRENKVTNENKDLHQTIRDLELRLSDAQDHSTTIAFSNSSILESNRQNLMDQITRLQSEVKALQYELMTTSERRDIDLQRYEERKQRTKAKLQKAREYYSLERTKYMEHMRQMDDDLRLTRAALQKELEWKDKMDSNYKHLLEEKRELISQLTEQEEALGDKGRTLSMVQVRVSYLEDENRHLQQRADSLTAQKQTLDRLVKDFQQNRDREAAGQIEGQERSEDSPPPLTFTGGSYTTVTSDLGNSSDVAWEQDLPEDGSLVFRKGSTLHASSATHRVPHSYHSHSNQDRRHLLQGQGIHLYKGHELYRFQGRSHSHNDGPEEDVVRLYREKLQREGDGQEEGDSCDEFEA